MICRCCSIQVAVVVDFRSMSRRVLARWSMRNEAATDGFDPSELEPDMSASSSAVRSI